MTGEHRPIPSTHVLTIAVVCLVLGLLCIGLIGCTQDITGPSCHQVVQQKVTASQWTEVNGRLVLITVTAPKVSTEVCE